MNITLDQLAMEALIDIRSDQPVKDRFHYFDAVLESDTSRGTLIQKLYVDIVSKSNIDFGKIPDSKGDITRCVYYKQMDESIGALNQLAVNRKTDELNTLNRLHDMIISCRGDYEFGFKFDIEFIKLTYNLLVLSLFEMINICIMEYANYLRDVKGIEFEFKKLKKKDLIVVRGVESMLKSFNNGEWNKMMSQFKKDPRNAFGMAAAISYINKIPGVNVEGNKDGSYSGKLSTGAVVAISIVSIILLLVGLRFLVYFFYSAATKIDAYVSLQKEFLEIAMDNDTESTDKTLKNQRRMLNLLDGVSSVIQTKILRTNENTKKNLKESNKENFNKADFSSSGVNPSDIELF